MGTEAREPVDRLGAMTQPAVMAWIPGATLDELRQAMSVHMHSDLLRAVLDEIHARDAAEAQRAAEALNRRRWIIATAIAVSAVVVSVVALLKP